MSHQLHMAVGMQYARNPAAGLPREAVRAVYTSAITKAGSNEAAARLGDAFVAARAQLQDSPEGAEQLLGVVLEALEYAITFSGCEAPREFAAGTMC